MQVKLYLSNTFVGDKLPLVSLRIWLNVINVVHMAVVAAYLLNIDFSQNDDPDVRSYSVKRWKLYSTWSNLLYASYLPVSIYCDWKELKCERGGHVLLNKIRHGCFTNILAPAIAFSDTLFWRLWHKDKTLIASQAVLDDYVPLWSQHSMHTSSLIFVVVDLLLVPRERPKNILPGLAHSIAFVTTYFVLCAADALQGEYIYPIFTRFERNKLIILIIFIYLEHAFFYLLQWLLVDFVWSKKKNDIKLS